MLNSRTFLFLLTICVCSIDISSPGCKGDTYGPQCSKDCNERHCFDESDCDSTTGKCEYLCEEGYHGIDCVKKCVKHYGKNCKLECAKRHCKYKDEECHFIFGYCNKGCGAGWKGQTCLDGCIDKTYGEECYQQCSDRHCKEDFTCDTIEGKCVKGCVVGWSGVDCRTRNVDGKWAKWAADHVGRCKASCIQRVDSTRTCTNPPPSKYGFNCTGNSTKYEWINCIGQDCIMIPTEQSSSTVAILIGVGGAVFAVAGSICCLMYYRKKAEATRLLAEEKQISGHKKEMGAHDNPAFSLDAQGHHEAHSPHTHERTHNHHPKDSKE